MCLLMTFIFYSDFVMYMQLTIAFLHKNKWQHSHFFLLSSFPSICNMFYLLHFLYWRLPCQHMGRLHNIFTSLFSLYLLSTMLSSLLPSFVVLISLIFSWISSFPFHSFFFFVLAQQHQFIWFRYFFCHISHCF